MTMMLTMRITSLMIQKSMLSTLGLPVGVEVEVEAVEDMPVAYLNPMIDSVDLPLKQSINQADFRGDHFLIIEYNIVLLSTMKSPLEEVANMSSRHRQLVSMQRTLPLLGQGISIER